MTKSLITELLELSKQYQDLVESNYLRSDLTRVSYIGQVKGIDRFTLKCIGNKYFGIPSCGWSEVWKFHPDEARWVWAEYPCPTCGRIVRVESEYNVGGSCGTLVSFPTPETQTEYERVGLEQHKLHVQLYETKRRLEKLL